MKSISTVVFLLLLTVFPSYTVAQKYDAFHPGAEQWLDTEGEHIQAHGGGILLHEGVYYWYGEQRGFGEMGVRCYSSTDLYNWQPHGVVLGWSDAPGTDLTRRCTVERPKVIYNEKTGKFVMWFHLELEGIGYWAARTGVAVADSPTGPFEYLRSFRPHVGKIPVNAPIENIHERKRWDEIIKNAEGDRERRIAGEIFMRDLGVGQMARDMTVFKDDDGTAYHIASSEENLTLHIAKLTDDYLNFSGEFARVQPDGRNEAPAVFKYEGKYYMIASGLTGWAPNRARSFVADSMLGPWEPLGNPCVGGANTYNDLGPDKTFGGQSTYVLPAPGYEGQGKFIAMFDIWQPGDLKKSRYMWLPLVIQDGKPVIEWAKQWKVSDFGTPDNQRGAER